jgi:hypothetical protein
MISFQVKDNNCSFFYHCEWLLRQHESGHFLTYGHFMSRPTALHCRTPDLYWHFVTVYIVLYRCVLKNIDDIVIFACQLWPKYDFNADLYLLQRKIWRDKKNINITMNGGQIRFYLRIHWRTELKGLYVNMDYQVKDNNYSFFLSLWMTL